MSHQPPKLLTLLPLRNTTVFPFVSIPLSVGRPRTVAAIEEAANRGNHLAIITQRDGSVDNPTPEDLYDVGVVCKISKITPLGDGTMNVTVFGLERFRVENFLRTDPFLELELSYLEEAEPKPLDERGVAYFDRLKQLLGEYLKLEKNAPEEVRGAVERIESAGMLTDRIAYHLRTSIEQKQAMLEAWDVPERLSLALQFLTQEIEVLKLSKKIGDEMKTGFDRSQRELMLREQLKAIKRELGEANEKDDEIIELQKAIAKANLPEAAEKAAKKELERLNRSSPMSAEYGMLRTYLEWILDIPWSKATEDNLDLERAQRTLDEDHYDLEKIKKRIVEFLAVRKLKKDSKGPILCFVGPPGVGKTSLGRSIARALGRKFTRISLGGVHDEAEVRGHRRTYVGALPGRILQGLKKAKTRNPVFMLDEIDKLSSDFRGDPASAMLEVLDPEQNHSFTDHYLGVPYDLSSTLFICTANRLDTVPPALKDRMEVVEIPGYTEEEKLHIAQRFLVPNALEDHGLGPDNIEIPNETLSAIVNQYTREAGVRNLGREIAACCRRVAHNVATGNDEKVIIQPQSLRDILGPIRHFSEFADDRPATGVTTGLIRTAVGGDLIFIEAARTEGKGELILTGSLGDVLKESARTAFSFLRARADRFEIDLESLDKSDLHIHIPAGAIPKDGPSAGITLLTAMLSLLTQKGVDPKLALSGEITLRGQLMPVGGVKEKLLAAQRAGIQRVFLPKRNEKDVEEVSMEVRKSLELTYFEEMSDVLTAVFPEGRAAEPSRPVM